MTAKPSDDDTDIQKAVDALNLGGKIRRLRQGLALTLRDVAERSGLSSSLISQIENELTAPPLATLIRIARTLGVGIGYFFQDSPAGNRISVVRAGDNQPPGPRRARQRRAGGYRYRSLAQPIVDQHMEPLWVAFEPRCKGRVHVVHHQGEEFVFVQEGVLEFATDTQKIRLEPGDSLYFDSQIPHSFRSVGDIQAEALVVIYTPS